VLSGIPSLSLRTGEPQTSKPTKIDRVINRKIGKTLGVPITRSVLIRADEMIQSGELRWPLRLCPRSPVLASTGYYRDGLLGAEVCLAQLRCRGPGPIGVIAWKHFPLIVPFAGQ
jgi:hypothetical protein